MHGPYTRSSGDGASCEPNPSPPSPLRDETRSGRQVSRTDVAPAGRTASPSLERDAHALRRVAEVGPHVGPATHEGHRAVAPGAAAGLVLARAHGAGRHRPAVLREAGADRRAADADVD